MKTSIRLGIFETNSSSTHSCVICKKSVFEDWKKGYYIYYGDEDVNSLNDSVLSLRDGAVLDLKKSGGFILTEDLLLKGISLNYWLDDIENNNLEDDLKDEIEQLLEEAGYENIYEFLYYEYNLITYKYFEEADLYTDITSQTIDNIDLIAFCVYGNDW